MGLYRTAFFCFAGQKPPFMQALGGKASKLSEACLSGSAATISNNRQPSILNRNRYRCVDGKSGLFQPETFQKDERRHAIAAGGGAFGDIVPVAFTNFEGAVVHS